MSSNEPVDSFPSPWLRKLTGFPPRLALNVAGYFVEVSISPDELKRVYLPTLNILQQHLGERRRIVAGLAGIPGSGKSTFAATLARLADTLWGMGRLVAIGLDGWHWPNTVLDERTTTDECGEPVPLRQRKGGPESFDVSALAAAIHDLQDATGPVSLPVYDRRVHDPVPGSITVGPGTSMVLIEGNFLLYQRAPWTELSSVLHPSFFLEWDPANARERVIARHVRGGTSPEQAARKYELNDRLNSEVVLDSAPHADYRISLSQPSVMRCS